MPQNTDQEVHEKHRDADPGDEEGELQVTVAPKPICPQVHGAWIFGLPLIGIVVQFISGVLSLVLEEVEVSEDGEAHRVGKRRVDREGVFSPRVQDNVGVGSASDTKEGDKEEGPGISHRRQNRK